MRSDLLKTLHHGICGTLTHGAKDLAPIRNLGLFDGDTVVSLQQFAITVKDLAVRRYVELRADFLLQLEDGGVGSKADLHASAAVLHMNLKTG